MEVITGNKALIVYKNIPDLATSLKLTITSQILSDELFLESAINSNVIEIECEPDGNQGPRTERNPFLFMLVVDSGENSPVRRSASMEKLFHSIANRKKEYDAMIIIPENMSTAVAKKAEEMKAPLKQYISIFHYKKFVLNIPKHVNISEHILLTKEEAHKILADDLKIEANASNRARLYDPPVVWIGGRPGDIVKIMRMSETAICIPAYRIVSPGQE